MLSWALQVATCVCAFSIDILILKSDFVASSCGFVAGITLATFRNKLLIQ
jgi:hypothetical protein